MSIYHLDSEAPSLISVLVRGICDHFRLRITSWFSATLLFSLGLVLAFNPSVFLDDHYRYMNRWYFQSAWVAICILLSLIRITALVVNGSFPNIKYMPHIRTAFASMSTLVWFQLVLGTIGATFTFESLVFPMLMILDMYNTSLAAVEMRLDNGRWRRYY